MEDATTSVALEASRREAVEMEARELEAAMRESLSSSSGAMPSTTSSTQPPPPLFDLSSLGLPPPPVVDEAVVAEIMAMGFSNAQDVRFALKASKGLMDEAVARLLGQ